MYRVEVDDDVVVKLTLLFLKFKVDVAVTVVVFGLSTKAVARLLGDFVAVVGFDFGGGGGGGTIKAKDLLSMLTEAEALLTLEFVTRQFLFVDVAFVAVVTIAFAAAAVVSDAIVDASVVASCCSVT